LPRQVLGDTVVFSCAKSQHTAARYLAVGLLQALARLCPRWKDLANANPPMLHHSPLGTPRLVLGNQQGPSLSFSHGAGRLWAAMGSKGQVGIDVAYPEEFANGYPLARAFRQEELDCAKTLCHGDTARGAALVWSAKEASVKATGAGFNRFDPRDVRVGPAVLQKQGILFDIWADRPISAWVRTQDRGWLSVALA
jgi:phosphopantetheinyl transferase